MTSFRQFVYSALPGSRKAENSFDSESRLLDTEEKDVDVKNLSRSEATLYAGSRAKWYQSRASILKYAHVILTLFLGVAVVTLFIHVNSI